ncbi:uncharacterized protein LOC110101870 [Dendrobium catenatum]|uniref:uncharacterized protein LOC110101870 n=1 Tax=Dendrobium catenatum TaxID=906689 RepID=UPI0010A09608|nr:uncharacterized protein LOC110101870 [Dendrobium catenatum]
MLDYAAPSTLPGDFNVRALRFALCCPHPWRRFVKNHQFGIANGYTRVNHSLIPSPLTLDNRNGYSIPISNKGERPELNRGGFLCSSSSISSSAENSGSSSDENPSTFESLKEFSGLRPSIRGEKERNGNGAPVFTTFDFLELKRELEKEENARAGSMEEELRSEGFDETSSSSVKEGIVVGKSCDRGGRRVMRRSNLLAKQVISMESACSLGFVSQLWIDTRSWVVALVEVRPNFLSGDAEKFLLEDVYQVGDVVLVRDESVLENELKMTGLDTLVGYDVVRPGRRSIGKIRGYTFNINTGAVESLEFDSFGFSIIPSSLVSTYRLSVEDVLDVESDKVIVYEEALSHVQRLTKGIWDTGNIGQSRDHLEASHYFRRKKAYSDQRRSSQSFRSPKSPEGVEDWDLPMDY